MTCTACDGSGQVLSYRDRPLAVDAERGRTALERFRNNNVALILALEHENAEEDLALAVLATVHFAHIPAHWTAIACPWCADAPRVTHETTTKVEQEEWLRGVRR